MGAQVADQPTGVEMPAGADGRGCRGGCRRGGHAEREQAADEDTSESFRSGHWGIPFRSAMSGAGKILATPPWATIEPAPQRARTSPTVGCGGNPTLWDSAVVRGDCRVRS